MKISFNIQYNAPKKAAPANDFERSFEQAVKARKNLALAATQAVIKDMSSTDRNNIGLVRGSVRASLGNAGVPDNQIQKVLVFVPFALASNLNSGKGSV